MPFLPEEPDFVGPLAKREGLTVTPEPESSDVSLAGGLWRRANIFGSEFSSFDFDPQKPFDPDFRPWEEIQGSDYERYATRFVGAQDSEDVARMKAQIDREIEDDRVIAMNGALGVAGGMAFSLLSPTTLLPGGAIVKGAKGISIARSALNVAGTAALAASIDETFLRHSQQTRTAADSALAIGGSFVLGSLLGAAAGKMAGGEFKATAARTEAVLSGMPEYIVARRSLGAAALSDADLTLRNEGFLQAIKKIPGLRIAVESDPLIRLQTSRSQNARWLTANLAESPSVYREAANGRSVLNGESPVETAILDRRASEEAVAVQSLRTSYGAYWKDGPVGFVGTLTAPYGRFFAHLTGRSRKVSQPEFFEEVGRAMFVGDTHPIPQVAEAAEALRGIFDRTAAEMTELGILPKDLRHGESYFSRIYKTALIEAHWGDGTELDLRPVLIREFTKGRDAARRVVGEDAAKAETAPKNDELEARAAMDDADIAVAVDDAKRSIAGLSQGEHHYRAALASPTRARVLDVPSEILLPWLDTNAEAVLAHYMRRVVPDLEIMKRFGTTDPTLGAEIQKVIDDYEAMILSAKAPREKTRLAKERDAAVRDARGIVARLRHQYGLPDDPSAWWVQGARIGRGISFPAYMGNVVMASIPDVANVIGRNGMESALGVAEFMRHPLRFFEGLKDAAEFEAFTELFLNGRAQTLSEMFDPLGRGSRAERVLAEAGSKFSIVSGIMPWNAFWKGYAGVVGASRLSKATADARSGTASARQLRLLGEGNVAGTMIDRIAGQLDQFADKTGALWYPQGRTWTDAEAYEVFRRAMGREIRLQVITPGQDVPLTFSNEGMKFFLQFKKFAWSVHHRLLLAGVSRADGELASQMALLVLLGGLVSNLRAGIAGREPKEGAAFWEDAIDRSGVAGWLFEPYNFASAVTGGALSISGEPVSRFQARSFAGGALGPTVDLSAGVIEAANAMATGKHSDRDIRNLMRPLPGSNMAHMSWLFDRIEAALVSATGARETR
jgi:hypothetical protein